jgi:hypothetical protein
MMKAFTRILTLLAAGSVAACLSAAPAAAHGGGGWGGWHVGIGIGPVFWPWPYYYAPPVYYAPPPVYYAPPGYYSPYPGYIAQFPPQAPSAPVAPGAGMAQSCNAGDYVCPMEATVPVGGRCYCRGNDGGRIYGTAQ